MGRYKNYYNKKTIQELAVKYVLFQHDTENSHTAAMKAIIQAMIAKNDPIPVTTHIQNARDVYNMLVPQPEQLL